MRSYFLNKWNIIEVRIEIIDQIEIDSYILCKESNCGEYLGKEISEEHMQNAKDIYENGVEHGYHHINDMIDCENEVCWESDSE